MTAAWRSRQADQMAGAAAPAGPSLKITAKYSREESADVEKVPKNPLGDSRGVPASAFVLFVKQESSFVLVEGQSENTHRVNTGGNAESAVLLWNAPGAAPGWVRDTRGSRVPSCPLVSPRVSSRSRCVTAQAITPHQCFNLGEDEMKPFSCSASAVFHRSAASGLGGLVSDQQFHCGAVVDRCSELTMCSP